MIEITNLQKTFEDSDLTVLKDISLKIEDGDIYGLVGRSGAGKSTLLRCINGLTGYQKGNLKVDGCEVKRAVWNSASGIPEKYRYDFSTVFTFGTQDSI